MFGTTVDGGQDTSLAFTMIGVDVAEDSDPELNEINATNYNEVFEDNDPTEDMSGSIVGDMEVYDPYMYDEEPFL